MYFKELLTMIAHLQFSTSARAAKSARIVGTSPNAIA